MGGKRPFLKKKITRREFLKYGLIGLSGLSIGSYVLGSLFKKGSRTDSFSNSSNPELAHIFKGDAPASLWKWNKKTPFQIKLDNNVVQCTICPNNCTLEPDDRSICRTRVNKEGTLYCLSYGNPAAVHIDPIEKKPLYHFLPGSGILSIATAGCNFRCLQCQNWTMSQVKPEETDNYDMMPERVVDAALVKSLPSIAYTYSGPIAFYEYMLDTAKLAKKNNLRNVWVTQAYMNKEPLGELCKYLDAANVDLKYFSEELYAKMSAGRLITVLEALKTLKEKNVWFEITNLVIPTINDDMDMIKNMCEWIKTNLGADYPLHFSRFHPQYKLTHLPSTPVKTLTEARKIALDSGLHYVYIGNVPGNNAQNTICPKCGKIVVEREGYLIKQLNINNGSCTFCGEDIAGVWS